MGFMFTVIWWVLFVLAALSYFISGFGYHGRGTKSPQIGATGGLGVMVFVILTFISSGWRGGIGIIVGLFLWAIVAEWCLWIIFRKLMPYATNMGFRLFLKRSSSYRSRTKMPTLEELRKQWNMNDEMLLKVSSRPEIIEVLKKYDKNPEYIKDIRSKLGGGGVEEYEIRSIIGNPRLLSEYLQMEADGVSDIEITHKFINSFGR